MADYELIEDRLISGRGVLKVGESNVKRRHSILYLDVVRLPRNPYLNNNYNPPRGKYAFLTFIREGYVVADASMEYRRQLVESVHDVAGQTLIAVKCAYDGLLTSLEVLSAALGLTVYPRTDLIKDYENLQLGWDEVRFSCYADTAIQARLYTLQYDSCTGDRDDQKKPPTPPAPLPLVPIGTPIGDISAPYDDDTSDDGNTAPYPGDEIPPDPNEPPGLDCAKYTVVVRVYTDFAPNPDYRDFTVRVYGKVLGVRKNFFSGQWAAVIDCRGFYAPTDQGCQSTTVARTVYNGINSYDPDPEIISFTYTP